MRQQGMGVVTGNATGTGCPMNLSPMQSGAAIKDWIIPAALQKNGSKTGGFSQQNLCGAHG
jgi:hypothetical protein